MPVIASQRLYTLGNCRWEFAPGPTPSSCWLSFSVDFAFKSPLYGQLATVFFKEVLPYPRRAASSLHSSCEHTASC